MKDNIDTKYNNGRIKCDTTAEYFTKLGHTAKPALKAIKENCIQCCGDDHPTRCTATSCPLYPFRLGKSPWKTKRVMTDVQREAARERLAKCRQTMTTL